MRFPTTCPAWALLLTVVHAAWGVAAEPVALRIESFTVAPSSQPVARVVVKNLLGEPYRGMVGLTVPAPWQVSPAAHNVSLAPGETASVGFDVQNGVSLAANRYRLVARATGGGATVERAQDVVAATAPYFKPTIDGATDDWDDAVPVTFTTAGKATQIRTFWNSRRFSLLVAVEEDRLVRFPGAGEEAPVDAVQLALSPKDAKTPTSADGQAARFEFLVVATADGGRCFQLAEPGTPAADTQERRALEGLITDDVDVAVSRQGTTTWYEIALPTRPLRDHIRPSEGREFCLSVLIHDPDGTGLRDWGAAAGLWPWERTALAWSRWPGDNRGEHPPFDNKTPWGMCSSKY